MNHSGDAAEQMVRLSLEGVEVAAKIAGSAAKEIAVLLIAALKNTDGKLKTHGKARLTSMLKSGKTLEIFSVKENDLKDFMKGAKQYGVVYCVLRNTKNKTDGVCDIMVKADDAPKISRLIERFNLATVDKAKINNGIVAEKVGKAPNIGNTEKLLDDLLGATEGNGEQELSGKESANRPFANEPPNTHPSKSTSESRSKSARDIPAKAYQAKTYQAKPSIKDELGKILAARKIKNLKDATVTAQKQWKIPDKIKFKKAKIWVLLMPSAV